MAPSLAIITDNREDVVRSELCPAIEEIEFDKKREAANRTAEIFDELARGRNRPSGCEQIVMDQHVFARADRVPVDLDGIGPVFEGIFLLELGCGQFPLFPDRDKAGIESERKSCPENEAPGFNACDLVYALPAIVGAENVDCFPEGTPILEQGRNVAEHNALLREVGYGPDGRNEVRVVGAHDFSSGTKSSLPFGRFFLQKRVDPLFAVIGHSRQRVEICGITQCIGDRHAMDSREEFFDQTER